MIFSTVAERLFANAASLRHGNLHRDDGPWDSGTREWMLKKRGWGMSVGAVLFYSAVVAARLGCAFVISCC